MFYRAYLNLLVSRIRRGVDSPSQRDCSKLHLLLPFICAFSVGFQGESCSSNNRGTSGVWGSDASLSVNAIVAAPDAPSGGRVVIGGQFSGIQNASSKNFATYLPQTNSFQGTIQKSLNGKVNAMVLVGNEVFVGGEFSGTSDGTVSLNRVGRYYLVDGSMTPIVDNQLNGTVYAFAVSGTSLYIGGDFTFPGGANIVKYDLESGSWTPLAHEGLDGPVYAITAIGDQIYVGGGFSATWDGEETASNIARYDPSTNTWGVMPGGGLNNEVYALVAAGDILYVGGAFQMTFDSSTQNLNAIARYRSADKIWEPLNGNGLISGSFGVVFALTILEDNLFVGGTFLRTHDGSTTNLNNIARYNSKSQSWFALPNGGLSSTVRALATIKVKVLGGPETRRLYAGGDFLHPWDNPNIKLGGITFFESSSESSAGALANGNEGTWEPLGFTNTKALNAQVDALELGPDGKIYAGGTFNSTMDGATVLNFIARYDPVSKTWSPLANNGLAGPVEALAIAGNDLYVGGSFLGTKNGAVPGLNRIARYDLTTNTWHALTDGGLNSFVQALAVSGNTLYVGGGFTATAGGSTTNINRIARYDTQTGNWSTLTGNGLNNFVNALAISGNDLYVGGFFTNRASGGLFNLWRIARYDISTDTWFQVGNFGLNGPVSKLGFYEGSLYVNGEFTQTIDGLEQLDRLGKYDPATSSWAPLSGDPDDYEAAVATSKIMRIGNDVYIAGNFTQVGGTVSFYWAQLYLQQWDTTTSDTNWFNDSNWTTGAVPATNTNAVVPEGSGNIEITSADVVLDDLNFNGGVLNIGPGRTLTINGTLALNGGIIEGEGTLVIASCQPDGIMGRGGNETSYIKARLVRCVNSTGTFNFPIGTQNSYSPVTIKKISGSGDVAMSAVEGPYPDTNGLPANRLARWWQIENIGGISATDVYFAYSDSDITGTEASYKAYRINGGNAVAVPTAINTFNNIAFAPGVTAFSDWTLAQLAPTAAAVTIAGRIFDPYGRGVRGARVTITDDLGNTRWATSFTFGHYRLSGVQAGRTYVIDVKAKVHRFTPIIVNVSDSITDLDFNAERLGDLIKKTTNPSSGRSP